MCSENKDTDKLYSYCTADRIFVFTYADCLFSGEATHLHKKL